MDKNNKNKTIIDNYITKTTIISGVSALTAHLMTGLLYPLELVKIRLQGNYYLYNIQIFKFYLH